MLNIATIRRRRLMGGAADLYAIEGNSPPVAADFVNEYYRVGGSATTFASMFTFSRSGTATYTDSSGTIQTAADGVARVGNHVYNGTSFVNKGILIETEARTNKFLHSGDFTNAVWQKSSLSVSGNTATISFSGARIFQNITLTSDVATTVWADLSLGTGGVHAALRAVGYDTQPAAWFNISTGTVGTVDSGLTATITEVADGVYRCAITFSSTTDVVGDFSIYPALTVDGAFGQTAGHTMVLHRAQCEEGRTPSSYIPTTTTTVTRNADSLVIAAANMSASTSAMSLQLDGTITYADEGAAAQQTFLRWQTDASNYISLDLDTDGAATGEVNANQAVGGTVDTVVAGAEYTAGVNVAFNIASRHTSGAINVAKDGTAATADTTPASLVDLSARDCELFQDAMGNIGQFRQWAVDLGDTGIETASS